jgi:ankyrin repeat protein
MASPINPSRISPKSAEQSSFFAKLFSESLLPSLERSVPSYPEKPVKSGTGKMSDVIKDKEVAKELSEFDGLSNFDQIWTSSLFASELTDDDGDNPLHIVAYRTDFPMAKMMVFFCKEERLDQQNKHGGTPLMAAAMKGSLDIVKLFLSPQKLEKKQGADVNLLDKENKNALHHAVLNKHWDIATFLNTYETKLKNQKDANGMTPADYIVFHMHSTDLKSGKPLFGDPLQKSKLQALAKELAPDSGVKTIHEIIKTLGFVPDDRKS